MFPLATLLDCNTPGFSFHILSLIARGFLFVENKMRTYKTVNDFKRNLPEVLDRISFLKNKRIPLCQYVIEKLVEICIDDSICGTNVVSEATYNNAQAELFKAQVELNYLTRTIKSLPNYKHHII